MSKRSTKLSIPHPHLESGALVGVLEQLAPDEPTQGRRIALLLHGTLGHKDYLYQKRLAARLPTDSFRFDFRGNFESGGTASFGRFSEDLVDLDVVADHLTKEYGYVIDVLVGHSRGSVCGMQWLCQTPHAQRARGFVNLSGRYRMKKVLDLLAKLQPEIDANGYAESRTIVARREVVRRVTAEDYHEFASNDTAMVWDRFPAHLHVLTVQGMKDQVVPPYDAFLWATAYSQRHPGTHNLRYVEEADHNFTGMQDEVVGIVVPWLDALERGELRTGVWGVGVKGKL